MQVFAAIFMLLKTWQNLPDGLFHQPEFRGIFRDSLANFFTAANPVQSPFGL